MCSMAMIATAVIAVVTHLPAAAEATSPINVPSDASQAAAATSLEPVVVLAEVSPDAAPAASGQESFANAPTPTSNLFEDFGREHPVGVTHNHGLTLSAASRRVLQGRVHGRLEANDRYAPRPALPHTGRRDSYKPPTIAWSVTISAIHNPPASTDRAIPNRLGRGRFLIECASVTACLSTMVSSATMCRSPGRRRADRPPRARTLALNFVQLSTKFRRLCAMAVP